MSEYITNKRKELFFLNNTLRKRLNPNVLLVNSIDEVIYSKYRIKQKMQVEVSDDLFLFSETNFTNNKSITTHNQTISSSYQRYDLTFKCDSMFNFVYRLSANLESFGSFTSCGMASITSILQCINSLYPSTNIYTSNDCYFETQHYIDNYANNIIINYCPSNSDKKNDLNILWFDSISSYSFELFTKGLISVEEFDLLIFDTTCYELGSKEILETVEWALNNNLPSILIRSHIKLDSLAMEYGRLGSLVVCFNDSICSYKMKNILNIAIHTKDILSRSGLNFNPYSLFPLQNDDGFHQINNERINRIKRNCKYFYKTLVENKKEYIKIYDYHHNLFVTLEADFLVERNQSDLIIRKLQSFLTKNMLDVKFADSFAFDFMALSWYKDYSTGKERIRISCSDYDKTTVTKIASGLLVYIDDERDKWLKTF